MTEYETKDSGTHLEYSSGMRRDSQDGKPRFDLIRTQRQPYEEQMIYRYAMLLARGAEKYSARNWEEGCGEEELERAKASLLRHTEQLIAGETDEDHAAAVWFNTQALEYFRWRLGQSEDYSIDQAARASQINRLALEKAAQLRRRERVRNAAKGFDWGEPEPATVEEASGGGLTAVQAMASIMDTPELTVSMDHVSPETIALSTGLSVEDIKARIDRATKDRVIDVNDDGTPFMQSDLERNQQRGALGLFQFEDAPWPRRPYRPVWTINQERLGAQIAENVRKAYEEYGAFRPKMTGVDTPTDTP